MGISKQWTQGTGPSPGGPGEIELRFHNDLTVVLLSGEVDLALRQSLDAVSTLVADFGAPVTVDLSEVTFIDSSGLAFLARLAAAGHADGWVPNVIGASGLVLDTIALSGLTSALNLTDPLKRQPPNAPTRTAGHFD